MPPSRPRPLSSIRTRSVFRAIRRAKASGLPMAHVNGNTVIASAPPIAAAEQLAQFLLPGRDAQVRLPGRVHDEQARTVETDRGVARVQPEFRRERGLGGGL